MSKSISTPPAVVPVTDPLTAAKYVPLPATDPGEVKFTSRVNGELIAVVPVPPVSEKNPSVSVGGMPEPIRAMPPESVTLNVPLVKVRFDVPVMRLAVEVGVQPVPKQPPVLPTKDVAVAAEVVASAVAPSAMRSNLRMTTSD